MQDDTQTTGESPEDQVVRPEFRAPARRRTRTPAKRRRGARSGDLFLLFIIFLMVIVFFAYDFERIFQLLYNQTAGLILIVVVVEYLVLKSMDRTRVYEMENVRLREQRRNDRALMRKARNLLVEGAERNDADTTEQELTRWETRALDLAEELGKRA